MSKLMEYVGVLLTVHCLWDGIFGLPDVVTPRQESLLNVGVSFGLALAYIGFNHWRSGAAEGGKDG